MTAKKSARINYRSPSASLKEAGFAGATVDFEYQLIACFGELHLAYGLVGGSVAQATPSYFYQGRYWAPAAPVPQVGTVDLRALVTDPAGRTVGQLHDPIAGTALGFGCFTGQTRKLANISDYLGPTPSQDQVVAFMNSLKVRLYTDGLLKGADAERELRAQLANTPAEIRKREKAAGDFIDSLGKP